MNRIRGLHRDDQPSITISHSATCRCRVRRAAAQGRQQRRHQGAPKPRGRGARAWELKAPMPQQGCAVAGTRHAGAQCRTVTTIPPSYHLRTLAPSPGLLGHYLLCPHLLLLASPLLNEPPAVHCPPPRKGPFMGLEEETVRKLL